MLSDLLSNKDQIEIRLGRLEFWGWFFGAVVAIGVIGEVYFGVRILINNSYLKSVTKDIDKERDRIESENDRQAKATSDQFKLEIAAANQRAAEANEKAEKERLERLKLEEKVAPRTLSPQQKQLLQDTLRSGPKGEIAVVPKTFDDEAEAYALVIKEVLENSGFNIVANTGRRPHSWGTTGVVMIVNDPNKLPSHAAFVQVCFRAAGIELPAHPMPDLYMPGLYDPSVLIIAVAAKP